jgi:hypothetical protein
LQAAAEGRLNLRGREAVWALRPRLELAEAF